MPVSIVGMSGGVIRRAHNHTHMVWEIVLNLQGCGYDIVGGRTYPFEPGSIICLPPGIPHAKTSEEGFSDIYIQPSYFSLSKVADENGVITLLDDQTKSFESLMYMAFRAFHNREANYQTLVDALYEAMHQLLLSWLYCNSNESDIERVKNRLLSSFSDPRFTISSLYSETHYCSDHLRRRFKNATGLTPAEYLSELRMNFAKKLLSENDILHLTIAEIGAMSGYYDNRYFSRAFKKKTGMSPREYIHSLNEKQDG